jgi:molybdate transport system substrate-binding protein
VRLFCTIGVQSAVQTLLPHVERANGLAVAVEWGTAPMLVKRIQAGERADVMILNRAGIDSMIAAGRIAAGSDVALASSGVAIAVRSGARHPDISTEAALVQTLLDARAISYSNPAAGGASGIYFAGLLERLGIAEQVNAKNKYPPPGGFCGEFVASGEVEFAIQQVPELLHVKGIEIVGELPDGLNLITSFAGGVDVASADASGGRALLAFLRTAEARATFRAKGLTPA